MEVEESENQDGGVIERVVDQSITNGEMKQVENDVITYPFYEVYFFESFLSTLLCLIYI